MKFSFSKKYCISTFFMIATSATLISASATAIIPDPDLNTISAAINDDGVASVRVLLVKTSLDELAKDAYKTERETKDKAETLIKILGSDALPEFRRISPLGSVDLLVTARGLEIIKSQNNVLEITAGDKWFSNNLIGDLNNDLSTIELQLSREGTAIVDIYFNIENAGFSFDKTTGKSNLVLNKSQKEEALNKAATTLISLGFDGTERNSISKSNSRLKLIDSDQLTGSGKITMQVDRRSLHSLTRNSSILLIKPILNQNSRLYFFDRSTIEKAHKEENGLAEVIVQIKMPMFSGSISSETQKVHNNINKGILEEILSTVNPKYVSLMPLQGTATAFLSVDDLLKLSQSTDQRLLGVVSNRAIFSLSLNTSTASTGVSNYWSSGLTGAGQTIWIFDSGISKNHSMLQKIGGGSKVVFEACFQTNDAGFKSTCTTDPSGDSLAAGSGDPMSAVDCGSDVFFQKRNCSHGTHVAGIAVGRYAPSLQGMAPEAQLASINVTSRAKFITDMGVYGADVLKAINLLADAVPQGAIYPAVVNLSLGGAPVKNPENWTMTDMDMITYSMGAAVIKLNNAGIPVVAAMGNYNYNYKIDQPAATNGVIKVGALINDINGKTYAGDASSNELILGANRANPSLFPNQAFFFAPGVSINSSIIDYQGGSTTMTYSVGGSSMSTPHVSGIYAAIKSARPDLSVSDITNFINSNFSYNVTVPTCADMNNVGCSDKIFKGIGSPRP